MSKAFGRKFAKSYECKYCGKCFSIRGIKRHQSACRKKQDEPVVVSPKDRVIEPGTDRVCIRGPDLYATMCGLLDDAYEDQSKKIKYGTRRMVTCRSCINAVLHASQFVSRHSSRKL